MAPCHGSSWLQILMIGMKVLTISVTVDGDSRPLCMDECFQTICEPLPRIRYFVIFAPIIELSFVFFVYCYVVSTTRVQDFFEP